MVHKIKNTRICDNSHCLNLFIVPENLFIRITIFFVQMILFENRILTATFRFKRTDNRYLVEQKQNKSIAICHLPFCVCAQK